MLSGVEDGSQSWKKVMQYAIYGSYYSVAKRRINK